FRLRAENRVRSGQLPPVDERLPCSERTCLTSPSGKGQSWLRLRSAQRYNESFRHRLTKLLRFSSVKPRTASFLVIVIVLFVLLLRSVRVVPAGDVGVVDLFGKVRAEPLPSGLHLVNPLARVHRMSIQTREVKETMDTPSSEGLVVHLEVSILFHLDP